MYIRLSDTFRNILSDFEEATAEVNSQKMLAKYITTICIFLTIIFSIFSKIAQFFYFCRMPTFTNNNFFVDTALHVPSPTLLVSLATLLIYSLTPFGAEINQAHIYITSGRGRENGVFMYIISGRGRKTTCPMALWPRLEWRQCVCIYKK